MRELSLNGYIDDDVWFGDEITPENLHEQLYGVHNEYADDVHIRLNSFGGSCNAAVRMFDDIRAYPGAVSITISGTAASAATMLCMAADRLEMTPGSLFMIHDPSMMAFGNERDLAESIELLRACKESILNMYERRVRMARADVADMMSATTWMDARNAFERGFVDAISDDPAKSPTNAADHKASVEDAEAHVREWIDRKKNPQKPAAVVKQEPIPEPEPAPESESVEEPEITPEPEPEDEPTTEPEHESTPEPVPAEEPVAAPEPDVKRVKVRQTDTRLNDLKY